VVSVLHELGPRPESVPYLISAWPLTTNSPYSPTRHDLVLTLSRVAKHDPERCLPIFLTEVNTRNEEMRSVAVWGLNALGPLAHSGVPAVCGMLFGTNTYTQFAAAETLGHLTNRMPALLPRLRELAHGSNGQGAAGAAFTLFLWGEPEAESIGVLTNLLSVKEAKGTAAEYLGKIGPDAASAMPALIVACQQEIGAWVDRYDRARCAIAILEIGGPNEIAINELKAALTYKSNPWVRYAVARDLGQMPEIAQPLVSALEKNLGDSDREARHSAEIALKKIQAGITREEKSTSRR